MAVAVLLLLSVFFFPERNGTRRWIVFQAISIQPSELAKLVAILFAAAILERRMHRVNDLLYTLLPIGIVTFGLAGLILVEPDFGTALFLALFSWVGGYRRPVTVAVVSVIGALALLVIFMRVAYVSLPLGVGPFKALSLVLLRLIGV